MDEQYLKMHPKKYKNWLKRRHQEIANWIIEETVNTFDTFNLLQKVSLLQVLFSRLRVLNLFIDVVLY